jgi:hypothetical protein
MTDGIPCRLLFCKGPECGRPIKLPTGRLLQLIVDPVDPSTHASEIALLCLHCMTIKRYSFAPESPDQCGMDHLVSLDRISGMSQPTWLKCDEVSCKALLPLISVWNPATIPEPLISNDKDPYPWNDLFCANGHPILYPQM